MVCRTRPQFFHLCVTNTADRIKPLISTYINARYPDIGSLSVRDFDTRYIPFSDLMVVTGVSLVTHKRMSGTGCRCTASLRVTRENNFHVCARNIQVTQRILVTRTSV